MKKAVILLAAIAVIAAGCTTNTYSKLRTKEKNLIDSYISRQGIHVVKSMPDVQQGEKWNEKDYLALEEYDQLYFHLVSAVDTTRELAAGDKVNIRFRKYSLDVYADTISYWTTDDAGEPIQMTIGSTSGTYNCTGWQAAILAMKQEGECKIICPSVYGVSDDNSTVTPYCYDLRVTKVK
ncbi:MAG: DUF4827 domain-containing protein [Paludibacteraceae bacterium]|nr:DUF4827 domain-containing protein [Paludibacteraceae bacterium]